MTKRLYFSSKSILLLLAAIVPLDYANRAIAKSNATLTVIVDGIRHQKGQVCLRVFGSPQGFPFEATGEVQSGCVAITGPSIQKQFQNLSPGVYAVAIIDDQNGDHKLHKDLLGIPKEGFGLSENPTVSVFTGVPKFKDASFALRQDTTIKINMKYSLD